MDTRTTQVYPTKEAAREAGVPEDCILEVVKFTCGPFKNRVYYRTPHGLVRLK